MCVMLCVMVYVHGVCAYCASIYMCVYPIVYVCASYCVCVCLVWVHRMCSWYACMVCVCLVCVCACAVCVCRVCAWCVCLGCMCAHMCVHVHVLAPHMFSFHSPVSVLASQR